ncbi:MAG: high-affinity branched-chain amino acid ABC transporter ATP-binding protein LivG [Cardiobacteriaceae bacterium]|nr:high-affinity branched-chain amino acid ABC transporter ATP-binding protein LivG [Cardiobacteriaceae bacterium]
MSVILEIEQLRMQFGGLVAVDQVNFTLHQQQIAAIIGPNGAGKTTVFNCISGFYRPTAGTIKLAGEVITGKSSFEIAQKGLTRTFQNIRLFKEMTVLENLLVAKHNALNRGYFSGIFKTKSYRESEQMALNQAKRYLEIFGLSAFANHEAGSLAYGQQRYLEIARCMMTQPKVLILDEPAAGLNPQETAALVKLIEYLRDEFQLSVLLIEHDMSLIMRISEHIMVMEYGRPLAYGTPVEIQNNPDVIKAYLGED